MPGTPVIVPQVISDFSCPWSCSLQAQTPTSSMFLHILPQDLFQCWESSVPLHWMEGGGEEWSLMPWRQLSTKVGIELEKKYSSLPFFLMATSRGFSYKSQRSCRNWASVATWVASLTHPYDCLLYTSLLSCSLTPAFWGHPPNYCLHPSPCLRLFLGRKLKWARYSGWFCCINQFAASFSLL